MVSVLGSRVLGGEPLVTITPAQQARADDTDWKTFAPPELLRRRANVQKALRDFPDKGRVLPTRLGQVLRRHEDMTGRASIESFVQKVFDSLPLSLRIDHDEQRTRLDLYCSMVFVVLLVTTVATARFTASHGTYAAGALLVGQILTTQMYRAAVASARAYGLLLVVISDHVRAASQEGAAEDESEEVGPAIERSIGRRPLRGAGAGL